MAQKLIFITPIPFIILDLGILLQLYGNWGPIRNSLIYFILIGICLFATFVSVL